MIPIKSRIPSTPAVYIVTLFVAALGLAGCSAGYMARAAYEEARVHGSPLILSVAPHVHAAGDVVRPLDRLCAGDEPPEEERAPREEAARDREQRAEPERAREDRYVPRAFLSSAEMAGTISWRSPITA